MQSKINLLNAANTQKLAASYDLYKSQSPLMWLIYRLFLHLLQNSFFLVLQCIFYNATMICSFLPYPRGHACTLCDPKCLVGKNDSVERERGERLQAEPR